MHQFIFQRYALQYISLYFTYFLACYYYYYYYYYFHSSAVQCSGFYPPKYGIEIGLKSPPLSGLSFPFPFGLLPGSSGKVVDCSVKNRGRRVVRFVDWDLHP